MVDYPEWVLPALVPIVIWSLLWKGLAMWHAARRADTIWFVILAVVNTVGVLELIYLYQAGKLRPGKLFHK